MAHTTINATVFITYYSEVTGVQRGATHLARDVHVGEYPRALVRRLSLILQCIRRAYYF